MSHQSPLIRRRNRQRGNRANEHRASTISVGGTRRSLRRQILKSGYLKKSPNSQNLLSAFQKSSWRWCVAILNFGSDPQVEIYKNQDSQLKGKIITTIDLNNCIGVRRLNDTKFSLLFSSRSFTFAAPSGQLLVEWVRLFESCLADQGILEPQGNGRNDYMDETFMTSQRRPEPLDHHYITESLPYDFEEERRLAGFVAETQDLYHHSNRRSNSANFDLAPDSSTLLRLPLDVVYHSETSSSLPYTTPYNRS